MNMDPRDTLDKPGTDPNQGMRTRPYMISIITALVLLLVLIILFVLHHRSAGSSPAEPATGNLRAPSTPGIAPSTLPLAAFAIRPS